MYDLEKQIKVGKTLRKSFMIDYEVPKLSLSGLWLQKAGFSIGDYAELLIRKDLIVLTPIESFKANKQELTKMIWQWESEKYMHHEYTINKRKSKHARSFAALWTKTRQK